MSLSILVSISNKYQRRVIANMPFCFDLKERRFQSGDTVRIIPNLSELQRLQRGHGGFLPQMIEVSKR